MVRLEQQLHDLMARMTEVRRQARYFSLPEEYQPNPHFTALLNLPLQTLVGAGGGGGTPGPGQGAAAAGGAAEPSPGGTGGEGGAEDMEQD